LTIYDNDIQYRNMRTIVDIPEEKIKELDELGKKENQPRAVLIREAIGEYLHRRKENGLEVFGLWKDKKIDSLKFERKIRKDWEK